MLVFLMTLDCKKAIGYRNYCNSVCYLRFGLEVVAGGHTDLYGGLAHRKHKFNPKPNQPKQRETINLKP